MEDDVKSYPRGSYLFGVRNCDVVSCYYNNKYYPPMEFTVNMLEEAGKLEKDLSHAKKRQEGKI